jgi:hypothetical protein
MSTPLSERDHIWFHCHGSQDPRAPILFPYKVIGPLSLAAELTHKGSDKRREEIEAGIILTRCFSAFALQDGDPSESRRTHQVENRLN